MTEQPQQPAPASEDTPEEAVSEDMTRRLVEDVRRLEESN